MINDVLMWLDYEIDKCNEGDGPFDSQIVYGIRKMAFTEVKNKILGDLLEKEDIDQKIIQHLFS